MDKNEIILYETADRAVKLNVTTDGNTVWLNRAQLAELFDRDIKTVGKHINNALKEELLGDNSVVAKFAPTHFCIALLHFLQLFILSCCRKCNNPTIANIATVTDTVF